MVQHTGDWDLRFRVGDTPWERLWALRDVSESRLSLWFRGLAAKGLQPQASREWIPRSFMTHRGATLIAKFRLRQIVQWCGGDWPTFLLNDKPGRPPKPSYALKPLGRVLPSGEVVRFDSTRAAARKTPRRAVETA